MKTMTWIVIVAAAKQNTVAEIADETGVSANTARRYLTEMVERGVVVETQQHYAKTYEATPAAREAAESLDFDKIGPAIGMGRA